MEKNRSENPAPPDIKADFAGLRVAVVGDLMLDEYIFGRVDRISPEAPVQVVAVTREDYTLGGAGNVVNNIVSLGAGAVVAGVIGDGPDGDRMMERFSALGADVSAVAREPGRRTTRKTRIIAAGQQVLRIDRETDQPVAQETLARIRSSLATAMASVDAVLISDYAKGLLTPALISAVVSGARSAGRPVLCDPKGRDFSKYAGVDLLTPNQKEAAEAAGVCLAGEADLERAAAILMRTANAPALLITRGPEGMMLFNPPAPPARIAAEARQVFDVSGAGDTVLAVMGLAMAAGRPMAEAARLANAAAGIVVGKVGTATVTPEELQAALAPPLSRADKYRSPARLAALAERLRRENRRIVFTNGCFDLLHAGHVLLFSASKRLGDTLIVAIDDDAAVGKLKGPGRPVIGQAERARMLGALDSVDYVTVFSEGELEGLIEAIRPDVLTKGDNTPESEIAGREILARYGGRIERVPILENLSASGIIDHIRNRQTRPSASGAASADSGGAS